MKKAQSSFSHTLRYNFCTNFFFQAALTALAENDPSDAKFYEITVYTGFPTNAGTTSNVYIQLCGDEDQTEPRLLKDDTGRKLFQTRAENVFLASFPKDIGDMQYVKVWHDNTGL